MKTTPSIETTTPRFSWRTWLSLAPVVALVGIGSWIVLQEQRLARQEAHEALSLSANQLMEDLENDLPLFAWFGGWSGVEENDILKQNHNLFISVDSEGRCLLPPLVTHPPLPEPYLLPWDKLDESQILLWNVIKKTDDPDQLLKSVQAFHQTNPPEPFFSLAEFRKIAWMVSDPQREGVSGVFESIKRLRQGLIGNPLTESGLPLSVALDFLEFERIKSLSKNPLVAASRLEEFANRQFVHPTPWTYQFLSGPLKTDEGTRILESFPLQFNNSMRKREKARQLHSTIPYEKWSEWGYLFSAYPRWIEFESESYLLCRVFQGEVYHFVALGSKGLKMQFGSKLKDWMQSDSANQAISFSLDILGKTFLAEESGDNQTTLANNRKNVQSTITSSSHPWFTVRAEILNPESYFTRSRRRTQSMLWLIGLAGVTGLFGWFAQRKAFKHQVELGRMKSNFVASVSHELRAPIASIRLMTENLSHQKGRTEAERQDYFQWIGLECRRLSSLVQNILQFSRLELGKRDYTFEAVDIGKLYRETLKLMEPLAANVQVKLESNINRADEAGQDAIPDAMWDGQAIHQALVNLIDNAIKHTPKEGVVRTELLLEEGAGSVEFLVIDQGPGIEEPDRERIFRPFERLGSEMTRKTKGVGIGLNLVWHTAQSHHGTIRVEPSPGGGACFILTLPLKAEKS